MIPNWFDLNSDIKNFCSEHIDAKAMEQLNKKYLPLFKDELAKWGENITEPSPYLERRFKTEAWLKNPYLLRFANLYCIYKTYVFDLIDAAHLDVLLQNKVKYSFTQWLEAISPSNFFATNAEAQQLFFDTQGQSLQNGFELLFQDLMKGRISQTDEKKFEIGENLGTTAGHIVYQDDLIELIQYHPTQKEVFKQPLLMVPPCINKFYILDLDEKQSFIRYALDQGYQVFLISWRNIGLDQATFDWDRYVQAILDAHKIVQNISQEKKIHLLGFCVGGTLLTTAASILAQKKQRETIASLSLLTTLLDFKQPGVLGALTDSSQFEWQEQLSQAEIPTLIPAQQLNGLFNSLRPADLIWNYVENSYLKGRSPAAFDILYWNSDSTNLPGKMVSQYLDQLYRNNCLIKPKSFVSLGVPIDLKQIQVPVYVLAAKEDHIVPWESAYDSFTYLLTTDNKSTSRFVLAASGHIAGVINPPVAHKRNYWQNPSHIQKRGNTFPEQAKTWLKTAEEQPGSWWQDWFEWLETKHQDPKNPRKIAPKTEGNKNYPSLREAPGEYVRVRAM